MTDRFLQAIIDYAVDEGEKPLLWDRRVHGLRLQVGRVRHVWSYYVERRFRGKRQYYFRRLGFFPTMNVVAARKAALVHAAKIAETHFDPGSRQATRLDAALSSYVAYLRAKSEAIGKDPKSSRNAASLSRRYLVPEFGSLTLKELSNSPQLVHDWHVKLSKKLPVTANSAARLLRAAYRRSARLDRSLPVALPTSAVELNREEPAQTALSFNRYAEWGRACSKLPSIRQGYYRLLLLTGMRGQEAQRLEWRDVDLRTRSITIRASKTDKTFSIPMTAAIAGALRMARGADAVLAFPGAKKFDDDLPAKGHALRHSFISTAHDIGINEIFVRLLVGHALTGVHASYLTRLVVEGGPGLRGAQRAISRRIKSLLGQA